MKEIEISGRADLQIGEKQIAGNGIQENVAPGNGAPGYWHSRGYLPHFESAGMIQHVTFHLADSLPKGALERLEDELMSLPPEKQAVEKHKRIEAWMAAGHGACILRETEIAEIMQNSLMYFDGNRYRLLAWVIMPNHVHVLFQPLNGWTVAKIVASWKKYSARKILDYLRDNQANYANQEIGDPGDTGVSRIWQREYWDRYMRDEQHLQQAIEYIHQNPVKAGLVGTAEGWPWSSARYSNQEIGAPSSPGGKT